MELGNRKNPQIKHRMEKWHKKGSKTKGENRPKEKPNVHAERLRTGLGIMGRGLFGIAKGAAKKLADPKFQAELSRVGENSRRFTSERLNAGSSGGHRKTKSKKRKR